MKTSSWHRTLGTWVGIIALLYASVEVARGHLSGYWFVPAIVLYYVFAITATVGYHRLFNHGSFQCHKVWHWIFGVLGCIGLNASPFHWSVLHSGHHAHSDTANDPYDSTWRYFFRLKNRRYPVYRSDMRLARQPMHQLLISHSLTICLAYVGVVTLSFGLNGFLFLFAIPAGCYLAVVGIHTMFAHHNKQPTNKWYMEYILPMSGEWIHKVHHDQPNLWDYRTKPHFFDLGSYVIRLIRTN